VTAEDESVKGEPDVVNDESAEDKEDSTSEGRIIERLIWFWERYQGDDGSIPREADVDIAELGEIWDDSFMIEVLPPDGRTGDQHATYRYAFMGERISEAHGGCLDGRDVYDALVEPYNKQLTQKFRRVVAAGRPLRDEAEFVNLRGMRIAYGQGLVPLAAPDGSVGFILGAMKWRAYITEQANAR